MLDPKNAHHSMTLTVLSRKLNCAHIPNSILVDCTVQGLSTDGTRLVTSHSGSNPSLLSVHVTMSRRGVIQFKDFKQLHVSFFHLAMAFIAGSK
ncbi:hypothetical protein FRX31_006093 [Thalictrum thalictroides]|uniref:Uncharacterized protein n=1 Tax=Thalictrum thalictroides TaxID=46969 RepID=A0A7J6X6X3_THATH|nr:hypothetical protein FRX31_006093 [Thalictrum thalictroides]